MKDRPDSAENCVHRVVIIADKAITVAGVGRSVLVAAKQHVLLVAQGEPEGAVLLNTSNEQIAAQVVVASLVHYDFVTTFVR